MKILQVHNKYLSGDGGEDVVLEADRRLLVENGHDVTQYFGSNADFGKVHGARRLVLGARAIWSRQQHDNIRATVRRVRPDVAHVHNTFGNLSGSVYWALARENVPVVQTIHNYRWICPAATLLREGKPCEECVGRVAFPAIRHGCRYNGSFSAAAIIGVSNAIHFEIGTYTRKISSIIALTEFMKAKLVQAGLDKNHIFVRPNFLAKVSSVSLPFDARDKRIVFVGLIDERKGVVPCCEAWTEASEPDWQLRFVGDGRLRSELTARWAAQPLINFTGWIPRQETLAQVASSRFLVLPSLWYEGLPMVLLEAMALGTPLIVPDHGAFPEIVDDGVNGIVFKAGDPQSLRAAFRRAMNMQKREWERLAAGALTRFAERYSATPAYEKLLRIYGAAIERSISAVGASGRVM